MVEAKVGYGRQIGIRSLVGTSRHEQILKQRKVGHNCSCTNSVLGSLPDTIIVARDWGESHLQADLGIVPLLAKVKRVSDAAVHMWMI